VADFKVRRAAKPSSGKPGPCGGRAMPTIQASSALPAQRPFTHPTGSLPNDVGTRSSVVPFHRWTRQPFESQAKVGESAEPKKRSHGPMRPLKSGSLLKYVMLDWVNNGAPIVPSLASGAR